ncbi:MAG TPA: hypothetical protein VGF77_08260 [Allosphingosinicella sp.]|jgi:hypothetical protein
MSDVALDDNWDDPWVDLGVPLGGYSSSVDDDILAVLKAIRDGSRRLRQNEDGPGNYVTDIAKVTGLSESHIELIQYIFCSCDWCDYGTSPRGCFPNWERFDDDGFDALISRFEAYYRRRWKEDPA